MVPLTACNTLEAGESVYTVHFDSQVDNKYKFKGTKRSDRRDQVKIELTLEPCPEIDGKYLGSYVIEYLNENSPDLRRREKKVDALYSLASDSFSIHLQGLPHAETWILKRVVQE